MEQPVHLQLMAVAEVELAQLSMELPLMEQVEPEVRNKNGGNGLAGQGATSGAGGGGAGNNANGERQQVAQEIRMLFPISEETEELVSQETQPVQLNTTGRAGSGGHVAWLPIEMGASEAQEGW